MQHLLPHKYNTVEKKARHITDQQKQLKCPCHSPPHTMDPGCCGCESSSEALSHVLFLFCHYFPLYNKSSNQAELLHKQSLTQAPKDGKTKATHGKNVTLSITQVMFNNIIQMKDISVLNIAVHTGNTVGCTAECWWGTVKVLLPCKFKSLELTRRDRGTNWHTEHKTTGPCRQLTTKDVLSYSKPEQLLHNMPLSFTQVVIPQ